MRRAPGLHESLRVFAAILTGDAEEEEEINNDNLTTDGHR